MAQHYKIQTAKEPVTREHTHTVARARIHTHTHTHIHTHMHTHTESHTHTHTRACARARALLRVKTGMAFKRGNRIRHEDTHPWKSMFEEDDPSDNYIR